MRSKKLSRVVVLNVWPQTTSSSISWKLVRYAGSWEPPAESKTHSCVFSWALQGFWVWELLAWRKGRTQRDTGWRRCFNLRGKSTLTWEWSQGCVFLRCYDSRPLCFPGGQDAYLEEEISHHSWGRWQVSWHCEWSPPAQGTSILEEVFEVLPLGSHLLGWCLVLRM